jgi:hypothetical protein
VNRDHVDELREFPLAVAQRLLSPHQFVDVDAHAIPLDNGAGVVTQRLRAALDPAMGAGRSALPISPDERRARFERVCERLIDRLAVIRMNHRQGSRPIWRDQILQSDARDVRDPLVEVARYSFCRRAPYESRHGVYELPQLALAPPQRLLGTHLIVDVVTQAIPLGNMPFVITQWLRAARHPAIGAVRATQPIPQGEALASNEGTVEGVPKLRRVLRMDGFYERFQSADARLVRIRYVQAEIVHHALVEEGRFTIGCQTPNVAWNHVHELGELHLSIAQRRLGSLLVLNVYCGAIPLRDATVAIARGSS